jgi:integrase
MSMERDVDRMNVSGASGVDDEAPRRRRQVSALEVLQRAIAECEAIPEWARLMLQIAWLTGLRQGEMWNLELRDIHVDGARPHIFVRFGSKGRAPKNGKTRRVPLLPEAVATMRRWLVVLKTYAPKNPQRLAFPGPTGARRQPGAPEKSVKVVRGKPTCTRIELLPLWLRAAGITRPFRWHDLRHTCGSSLVAGWRGRKWSLLEVCDLLGHRDVGITQRCAQLAESELDRAAKQTAQTSCMGDEWGRHIWRPERLGLHGAMASMPGLARCRPASGISHPLTGRFESEISRPPTSGLREDRSAANLSSPADRA